MFFLWFFFNVFSQLDAWQRFATSRMTFWMLMGALKRSWEHPWIRIFFINFFWCVPPSRHLEKVFSKINAMSSALMSMWKLSWAHGCSREFPWIRMFLCNIFLMSSPKPATCKGL
jgi:hypothetical protein